jgi:hypothetical protein
MIPEDKDRCTAEKEVLPNTFPARRCFRKKHDENDGVHRFTMTREEINTFMNNIRGN